jgi:hypothetical protein
VLVTSEQLTPVSESLWVLGFCGCVSEGHCRPLLGLGLGLILSQIGVWGVHPSFATVLPVGSCHWTR